ncbi:unnamed protein product [Calypogeia fissa]
MQKNKEKVFHAIIHQSRSHFPLFVNKCSPFLRSRPLHSRLRGAAFDIRDRLLFVPSGQEGNGSETARSSARESRTVDIDDLLPASRRLSACRSASLATCLSACLSIEVLDIN